MGDHFSFKWTDFRSSLTQGFHDFLQEEMMVDVTLAAEGKFVQAHKLVLSVCSPYFKTLFKVNPCKHPIVILQDTGHSELASMLEFIYKGEVGVRQENLKSFLKLADILKIKGLEGKNFQVDEYLNKVARVKKKYKDEEAKNIHNFKCLNEFSEKKVLRKRKRRLHKLDSVKKLKKNEISDSVSVNMNMHDNNICVSEDEDNNPLINLIKGEKTKSSENSKHSESEIKNSVSFSDWDDGVGPSDYSENAEDFEAFFPTVHTEDSEQAPQDILSMPKRTKNVRTSLIWRYFIKYPESATCRLCGKNFKGFRPHTSIECHLKTRHYKHYLDFTRNREEQRNQLRARDHLGNFLRFYGMANFNY